MMHAKCFLQASRVACILNGECPSAFVSVYCDKSLVVIEFLLAAI